MKRISLTAWILIGLVAGIAFGAVLPGPAKEMALLGTIFLRLIKSIIAPLLFGTLVVRHRRHGQREDDGPHRRQGDSVFRNRHHGRAVCRSGRGESGEAGRGRAAAEGRGAGRRRRPAPASRRFSNTPSPPALSTRWRRAKCCRSSSSRSSSARPARRSARRREPVVRFCESLSEVMFKYTNYVMYFAPFGVFGAMAATDRR